MTTNYPAHPSLRHQSAKRIPSAVIDSPALKLALGLLVVVCCVTPVMAQDSQVGAQATRQHGSAPKKKSSLHSGALEAHSVRAPATHTLHTPKQNSQTAKLHPPGPCAGDIDCASRSKGANNGTDRDIIFVGGRTRHAGDTQALNPQPIPPGHGTHAGQPRRQAAHVPKPSNNGAAANLGYQH